MKALSIRQPWAWAILHAGKDVENRDWISAGKNRRDAHALMTRGEQFLLHASATMRKRDDYQACRDLLIDLNPEDALRLPKWGEWADIGGIVGIGRIVEIADTVKSPWFFGPVGLVLADVKPCKFTPFKGALGFFDVPDHIAREALAG